MNDRDLRRSDRATLDAIIRNKYSSNPDKLLAWKSASHTERATPAPVA